jgi:hypothetical protein
MVQARDDLDVERVDSEDAARHLAHDGEDFNRRRGEISPAGEK